MVIVLQMGKLSPKGSSDLFSVIHLEGTKDMIQIQVLLRTSNLKFYRFVNVSYRVKSASPKTVENMPHSSFLFPTLLIPNIVLGAE